MMATSTVAPEAPDRLPPEPYPGLRPYEPTEWGIFFGREPMIDDVIAHLAKQHLVIIHGASGCGKSSLIRAGVFPWLAFDHARSGKGWVTAIVRPSGGPVRNIAQALAEILGAPPSSDSSPAEAVAAWHDHLASGTAVLSEISRALELRNGTSLCLLIDQFEELFRYAKQTSREEARLVVELLKAVADPNFPPRHFFVVLTMRSDYLGECSRFEGFAETVNPCQYLLPQLDDFALLRAIHEPAVLYGGKIDPAVGDRLIFAARHEEDALPILQHALMRASTYARKRPGSNEGWTVSLADLEAIAGKNGALSQHADEVLAELTASDTMNLKIAEWLFRSLTELNAEGSVIRRPSRIADLVAVAGGDRSRIVSVIGAFRAPGRNFLTINPPGPLADASEIDVSHEALIRRWEQLSDPTRDPVLNQPVGWVWREFEDGQRWRALAVQARVFRDDVSKSAALSPATTAVYETWWPEHTPAWAARYAQNKERASAEYREVEDLWQASKNALEFERSRLKREAQELEQEQSRKQKERFKRWMFNVVVIALVFTTASAFFAVWQSMESQRNSLAAERSAVEARQFAAAAQREANQVLVTQSRFLADLANQYTRAGDSGTAILLALEAIPDSRRVPERPYVPEVEAALLSALQHLQELLLLQGHNGPVLSALFSPDGQRVLTASDDRTARIWDASSGKQIGPPLRQDGPVLSAVFSPDGQRVLTASDDGTARIWDAESGEPIGAALRQDGQVLSAVFSQDGRLVLTASNNGTARIWDAQTGGEIRVFQGHTSSLRSAVFSPDGNRLLTASADKTARIWGTQTGREIAVLLGHTSSLRSAVFSPDGKRVLTASADNTFRIWDGTGKPMATLQHTTSTASLRSAVFSPDGQHALTVSTDNTARIWDAQTEKLIAVLDGHTGPVLDAVFSLDGGRVITASTDRTARIWSVRPGDLTGTQVGKEITVLGEHTGHILSAVFSPDAQRVLTASDDRTARIWDARTGEQAAIFRGNQGPVLSAVFSPDGQRVLTASDDRTARIWDASSGKQIGIPLRQDGPVLSAVFSPDGRLVLTASDDGTARIWDAESGAEIAILRGGTGPVLSAVFSPDGQRVLTASKDLRIWDAPTGRLVAIVKDAGSALGATFGPDGQRVLQIHDGGTVRIWDARTGGSVTKFQSDTGPLLSAVFSPDGQRVLATSADKTARIWDAQTGREIAILLGHTGSLSSAVFSPDGRRVLTASDDGTARIWDARTGKQATIFESHHGPVLSAVFSPDGQRVLTTSADNTARIWRTFLTTQALVDEAKERTPRCLTREQRVRAFLDAEPPVWCIERGKWPNDTLGWTDWLRYERENANPPLPDTPEWTSWLASKRR